VKFTFVGSGDAFGSGGRSQTCMQLEASDFTALIDCGASSLIAMKAQGHDPSAVDAVVLSHLHGDHFGGLPFLVLDGQFSRRTRPLTVLGPQGTAERLQAAMEILYPGSTQVQRRFRVDVHELDGRGTAITNGGMAVRGYEVDHACGAPPLAVTVELNSVTVGYSGDTAWTPALLQPAQSSDLFICEAYTYDRTVRYHLSYAAIREQREKFGDCRLVLTHMGPDMLGRLAEVEDHTAHDGLVLDL
jgi:ribonuclease BN (tRNA processing enzyme)